jgi:hypothetical protein
MGTISIAAVEKDSTWDHSKAKSIPIDGQIANFDQQDRIETEFPGFANFWNGFCEIAGMVVTR